MPNLCGFGGKRRAAYIVSVRSRAHPLSLVKLGQLLYQMGLPCAGSASFLSRIQYCAACNPSLRHVAQFEWLRASPVSNAALHERSSFCLGISSYTEPCNVRRGGEVCCEPGIQCHENMPVQQRDGFSLQGYQGAFQTRMLCLIYCETTIATWCLTFWRCLLSICCV